MRLVTSAVGCSTTKTRQKSISCSKVVIAHHDNCMQLGWYAFHQGIQLVWPICICKRRNNEEQTDTPWIGKIIATRLKPEPEVRVQWTYHLLTLKSSISDDNHLFIKNHFNTLCTTAFIMFEHANIFTIHKSCQVKKSQTLTVVKSHWQNQVRTQSTKKKSTKLLMLRSRKLWYILVRVWHQKKINDSKKLSVNYSAQIELWLLNFFTWLINFNFQWFTNMHKMLIN
jgi:hypothetical protein